MANFKMDCKPMRRKREVLTIGEKMKIINIIETEKLSFAKLANMYGKNESSIREVWKSRDKIRSNFIVAPQCSRVRDKVLLRTEKALNLWMEDKVLKGESFSGNTLRQKALSLYKGMRPQDATEEEIINKRPFTASKGWLHSFKNRWSLSSCIKSELLEVNHSPDDEPTFVDTSLDEQNRQVEDNDEKSGFIQTCTVTPQDPLRTSYLDESEAFSIYVAQKLKMIQSTSQKMLAETLITQVIQKATFNQLTQNSIISEGHSLFSNVSHEVPSFIKPAFSPSNTEENY